MISDSRTSTQIGSAGWIADFPAASDFVDVKLSCRAFLRANRLNYNDAEYCSPEIDARTHRAEALQATNPRAANDVWAAVDGALVDDAPWLPTVTRRTFDFVSKRVGNYQFHPLWGLLVDQVWVR